MSPEALIAGRLARGWPQVEAAKRLGISQSYLSMLETGDRVVTPALARKSARVYGLPPTVFALPPQPATDPGDLTVELAKLGYPAFAPAPARNRRNPAEVLITALAKSDLDTRVAEALPWLLLRFPEMSWKWVITQAKTHDLQNRLGYVVHLARRIAESGERYRSATPLLAERESTLERSRLAREDTLCRESMMEPEREWLRAVRPPEAAHWNLLTSITTDQLRYER